MLKHNVIGVNSSSILIPAVFCSELLRLYAVIASSASNADSLDISVVSMKNDIARMNIQQTVPVMERISGFIGNRSPKIATLVLAIKGAILENKECHRFSCNTFLFGCYLLGGRGVFRDHLFSGGFSHLSFDFSALGFFSCFLLSNNSGLCVLNLLQNCCLVSRIGSLNKAGKCHRILEHAYFAFERNSKELTIKFGDGTRAEGLMLY